MHLMSRLNSAVVKTESKGRDSVRSRWMAQLVRLSRSSGFPVLQTGRRWVAAYHDARLNIDTAWIDADRAGGGATPGSVHGDGVRYESPDYRNLQRVFNVLSLGSDDVFYDLGCGKGRVLCLAARYPIRKAVGIEIVPDLCRAARRNAMALRLRRAPIALLCADACHAPLDGGTVYFMFNAFGAGTLSEALDNLAASIDAEPREVRIVYYNAKHEDELRRRPWLEEYDSFQTLTGRKVSFWRSV